MSRLVDNDILIPEIGRLLKEGREVRFTPSGESMRPFIEGNKDSVLLRAADVIRMGDIVLADLGDRFVLHRVIEIDADGTALTLMGDGNLRGVEYCAFKDVLGVVIGIYWPSGRRKLLSRAWLWRHTLSLRWLGLKIYRHLIRWGLIYSDDSR